MSSSTKSDPTRALLDAISTHAVVTVAFHPDGIHLLGGGKNGTRRWRLEDGHQVGKQTGIDLIQDLIAISISRDHKWMVCGTGLGASVWDAEMEEKIIDVEGRNAVNAVDVSPDSTTFATGTDRAVSVWSITSGERLVGPLRHDIFVTAIRFSPNGERIATASIGRSIRVFDSRNGDEIITIDTVTPSIIPCTPFAWSDDGQQIFCTSEDNKIKLFDVSTGSQLAETQILDGGKVDSIALAVNGKFIATFTNRTVLFLDTSTLSRIDPAIEDSEEIWAIAISPDSHYLATGRRDGKIAIRNLGRILPDSYGPFHTSHRDSEKQSDEQSSTSGRDNKPSDSPEKPRQSSALEGETGGDEDLLEVKIPSGMLAPEFNFEEPSSPESSTHHEDEAPPLDASHAVVPLSDTIPVIYPPLARGEEHVDVVELSRGIAKFRKWVQMRIKKSDKDHILHEPDRVARKSRRPANTQLPSQSPARVDATNEGRSWMAAGQRVPRMVATSPEEPKADSSLGLYARIRQALQPKSPTEDAHASDPKEDTSCAGQDSANPPEVGPEQANDGSHPSAGRVHLTRESGKATLEANINVKLSR